MTDPETVSNVGEAGWPDEEPIPPRYWWLKRILAAIGILVLALACLRLWWGWEAHRRLQAEIDKIVAAGEPIYPQDFDPPEPVPDADNAAKLLLDAEVALNLTPDEDRLIDEALGSRVVLRQRLDDIGKIVEANTKALDRVHQARSCAAVDWGLRIRTPAMNFLLPPLSGQRALAKLLSVTAGYHHADGDNAAAIETLRDGFGQVRAIDSGPAVISHLVAIAMDALSCRRVEGLAPVVTVRTDVSGAAPHGSPATREQVSALVAELLDEDGIREAFIRAMQSERMVQLDTIEGVVNGQMTRSALAAGYFGASAGQVWHWIPVPLIRPLYELDAIFGIEWTTKCVDAARSANWPAAAAASPTELLEMTSWEQMMHPISYMMLPLLERFALLHFRALAMRRMAAVALSIRLYEVDHGRRPAALSDLIPEYLPEIPLDPFGDDGRAISYRPDATPPVLYSISQDSVDDGGAYTFYRNNRRIHRDKLDIPFFLDGKRPHEIDSENEEAGGSTERRDDQDEVDDTEGNPEQNQPGQDNP